MRHRLPLAAIPALACALFGTACSQSAKPVVQVAEVRRAPLRVAVATNGKVEPMEAAEVRARLEGRLLEIPEPGARVERGAPLLRIDPGTVGAQIATAGVRAARGAGGAPGWP